MTSTSSHILQFKDLSIGYAKSVLQNVNFELPASGLVGIIGNNGKGKTTLLKSISGLLEPLAGEILFGGKNIFDLTAAERSKLVSFSFSSNQISFPVSVFELVGMGRYPYTNHWASLSKEDEQIISNAIESCGITHLKNNFVTGLSDGERQKAFIAKTLAQQTPVMLFDEPTAFLDYASKKHFFQIIKGIAKEEQKLILVSSHDIDFLTAYADQLFMIENDGKIVSGKTDEIAASNYFEQHFTRK